MKNTLNLKAIKENFNFCYKYLENIIINFIIDNYFKEKYQRINLFFLEFVYAEVSSDNNKTINVRIVLIYSKVLHEIWDESPNIINLIKI